MWSIFIFEPKRLIMWFNDHFAFSKKWLNPSKIFSWSSGPIDTKFGIHHLHAMHFQVWSIVLSHLRPKGWLVTWFDRHFDYFKIEAFKNLLMRLQIVWFEIHHLIFLSLYKKIGKTHRLTWNLTYTYYIWNSSNFDPKFATSHVLWQPFRFKDNSQTLSYSNLLANWYTITSWSV